jgi:hypothetical protein
MSFFQKFIDGSEPEPAPKAWQNNYPATSRKRHVGSIAPSVEEAAAVLRKRVDELARNGALDEGSGSFFDAMIASWVEQWHNDIDHEHEARQSELHLEQARLKAELERRRAYEDAAKRHLEELNAEIEALRQVTDGNDTERRRRGNADD